MDPTEFNKLLGAGQNAEAAPTDAPATPEPAGAINPKTGQPWSEFVPEQLDAEGLGLSSSESVQAEQLRRNPSLGYASGMTTEPGLGDPTALDALTGGAAKGIFETKDFVMGEPTDKSEFRKGVEADVKRRGSESIVDGFAAGIGQFAIGMIGLGKAKWAAEGLGVVSKVFTAVEATKKGKVALEAGKAAVVGATAFDPYEERLSNLIQDTPLSNPVNAWLAASPDDSAAEGRMKAALESIGLDATLLGVFLGSTKILKYLKAGDTEKASTLVDTLQAEQKAAIDAEEAVQAPTVPDAEPVGGPLPNTPEASPVAAVPDAEPVGGPLPPKDGAVPPAEPVGPQTDPKPASAAVEPDIEVAVADTPTQAANAAGVDLAGTPNPSAKPKVNLTDENTAAVYDGMVADIEAIKKYGGWENAVMNGHIFGKKQDGIPYHKFNGDGDMNDFVSRTVDAVEERLNTIKGGAVLTDKEVAKQVAQRVELFGDDPAAVLGMIQQSGANAKRLVADMEAGYAISSRMFQDTHALALKIKIGDFAEFGSRQAAMETLKQRLSQAVSIYGAARSITASSGRGVRRMGRQFQIDPELLAKLGQVDPDTLTDLISASGGNPKNLAKLANPSILTKITDVASYVYVNNLVSGWKTQVVNLIGNGYMLGIRPMERILGSVVPAAMGSGSSRRVLTESLKQYSYMGTALGDGWQAAFEAFKRNDSIMSPHKIEATQQSRDVIQRMGDVGYLPMNSFENVIQNALTFASNPKAAAKTGLIAVGLPTRVLGTTDELMKQITYRSKVMAGANMEAMEEVANQGLKGQEAKDFVKAFVQKATDAAFDGEGRALNPEALREAQIATFQQDLLPNSVGKGIQTFSSNTPVMKFILPFVKTPTNILRYGWKMTPGLNLLQREYQSMLKGEVGKEAQAQAIGQMAMGTLFMGTAGMLASEGKITGGGPSDFKQKAALQATGWMPYSRVIENDDGTKTYIPFGRIDPIAIPMGIIADIQDMIHILQDEEDVGIMNGIGGLTMALAKQFTSKSYLQGLKQFTDALSDPEASLARTGSTMAANFIPYSAMMRQVNPDPYMREARDLVDKLMATVPGLSENVPAKYDAWGDPMITRKGLWSSEEDQTVDREQQRLIMEGGSSLTSANPSQRGVDLRDLTTIDGQNAFEMYQKLSGKPSKKSPPLKSVVAKVMNTDAYKRAPDGDVGTKGTKLWILHPVVEKYREAAMRVLLKDPVVKQAVSKKDAEVLKAYKALKDAQSTQAAPQKNSTLGGVGAAFGQNLEALEK